MKSAAYDKQNSCKKRCSSIYWCNYENMLSLIFWATRIESNCSSIKRCKKFWLKGWSHILSTDYTPEQYWIVTRCSSFVCNERALKKGKVSIICLSFFLVEEFACRKDRVEMRNMTQTGLAFKVPSSIYFSHWGACFYWSPGNSLYRPGGREQC